MQVCLSSRGPVLKMVDLQVPCPIATRILTSMVPFLKRPGQRFSDPATFAPHVQHMPLPVLDHLHHLRIAGQSSGRFRGNVSGVLHVRPPVLSGIGQYLGVHVYHQQILWRRLSPGTPLLLFLWLCVQTGLQCMLGYQAKGLHPEGAFHVLLIPDLLTCPT